MPKKLSLKGYTKKAAENIDMKRVETQVNWMDKKEEE